MKGDKIGQFFSSILLRKFAIVERIQNPNMLR